MEIEPEFVRQRLADFEVPRIVEVHAELPRLESGKILRRALRSAFSQHQA
jgi:long-chain acyl-CoA synthetase